MYGYTENGLKQSRSYVSFCLSPCSWTAEKISQFCEVETPQNLEILPDHDDHDHCGGLRICETGSDTYTLTANRRLWMWRATKPLEFIRFAYIRYSEPVR